MKKIIDLNKNWLYSAKETENGRAFSDTVMDLPFFHTAETMAEGTFSVKWTPAESEDGKTVYIEFQQISGEAKIYLGDTLLGVHREGLFRFRQLLSLEVHMGEEYEIRVEVTPGSRPDALFAFAGVSLICVDSSHFNMTENEKNLSITSVIKDKKAEITVSTDIVRPNNYDVVSYTVTDMKGDVLFSKTCKPTEPCAVFSLDMPEFWDGQSGAYLYELNAKLLRDSRCLDEISTSFGLRDIKLRSDGFLYLNGFRLPLNGVALTDCSSIKSDCMKLRDLDGNLLLAKLLPSKTDLLSVTDKDGMLFWYDLHYSGDTDKDINELKDFLLLNRNHPSLTAVVCSEKADDNYFRLFRETVKKYAPAVFPVLRRDINTAADTIPEGADVLMLTIPCKSEPDAFISIGGRFSELQNRYPDKYFAIYPENPERTETTENEHNDWHIRLWTAFCRQKNVIAYFGGFLTDGKTVDSKRGLVSADRSTEYDAFWYYRSQFSAKSFVKICNTDTNETADKFSDIRCITNCKNLRILINGKDKKHKAEKITDGVYVFRQIKLKKDVNLIEVSADDECDSIEILRF